MKAAGCRSSVKALLVLAMMWLGTRAVTAQSSCPTPKYQGNQWPPNSTVYYDDSNLDPATKSAVEKAASDWNTANQSNGSGVTFTPAASQNPANLVFSNSPTNIPGTTTSCTPGQNQGALTCTITQGGTQNTAAAAVVFNKSATTSGNPPQAVYDPTASTYGPFLQKVTRHELGHTMGLGEQANTCTGTPNTVMNGGCGTNDVGGNDPTAITSCDQSMVGAEYAPPPPPPPPNDCDPTVDLLCIGSPIIIDTEAEGFHLTSPAGGVTFDISGTGHPVEMAWTDSHFRNAFLALPGPDGLVNSGRELFGNFTPQPDSPHPNGFLALSEYDKLENGGNGDGIIDDRDQVYSQLRLWIDENHDGICQPQELHPLPELGVFSLSLHFTESRRTDQFGNQFRYRAMVNPTGRRDPRDETSSGDPARWTYDVFLLIK